MGSTVFFFFHILKLIALVFLALAAIIHFLLQGREEVHLSLHVFAWKQWSFSVKIKTQHSCRDSDALGTRIKNVAQNAALGDIGGLLVDN